LSEHNKENSDNQTKNIVINTDLKWKPDYDSVESDDDKSNNPRDIALDSRDVGQDPPCDGTKTRTKNEEKSRHEIKKTIVESSDENSSKETRKRSNKNREGRERDKTKEKRREKVGGKYVEKKTVKKIET